MMYLPLFFKLIFPHFENVFLFGVLLEKLTKINENKNRQKVIKIATKNRLMI